MWNGKPVELQCWSEFTLALPRELDSIGHNGLVLVRNFLLQTYELDEDEEIIGEIDRLHLVRHTGTDRDESSWMWNAVGHDFEHDKTPSGKASSDIIYAYVAETNNNGYMVHYHSEPESMDLTKGLTDYEGLLIYDASRLQRVAKNEHWFMTDPQEALLLVFTLDAAG